MVVGINTGENEKDRRPIATAFKEKHGLTFPIWLDTEDKTMEVYGGEGFPTNAIVDRKGNLRYAQSGFDGVALKQLVDRLLDEAP